MIQAIENMNEFYKNIRIDKIFPLVIHQFDVKKITLYVNFHTFPEDAVTGSTG